MCMVAREHFITIIISSGGRATEKQRQGTGAVAPPPWHRPCSMTGRTAVIDPPLRETVFRWILQPLGPTAFFWQHRWRSDVFGRYFLFVFIVLRKKLTITIIHNNPRYGPIQVKRVMRLPFSMHGTAAFCSRSYTQCPIDSPYIYIQLLCVIFCMWCAHKRKEI